MTLVIILSDSESENEIAPNPPVVSSPSDSSEPEEFVPETEAEPEVESRESKIAASPKPASSSSSHLAPLRRMYHTGGPSTITVPKKRVAIRGRGKGPLIPSLSGDPYLEPKPTIDPNVGRTQETLGKWRKLDIFSPFPEIEESSRSQFPFTREPPHHTIPILIAHGARLDTHDDRLDIIEDALSEIPTYEEVIHDANITFFQAQKVKEFAENVKVKVEENKLDVKEIKQEFGALNVRMDLMESMLRKYIWDKEKKKNDKPSKSC